MSKLSLFRPVPSGFQRASRGLHENNLCIFQHTNSTVKGPMSHREYHNRAVRFSAVGTETKRNPKEFTGQRFAAVSPDTAGGLSRRKTVRNPQGDVRIVRHGEDANCHGQRETRQG